MRGFPDAESELVPERGQPNQKRDGLSNIQHLCGQAPFPLTTIIATMAPHPYIAYFSTLLSTLQAGIDEDWGDAWVARITASYLTQPKVVLGGETLFSLIGIAIPFSSDPPTGPSLPQEELQLLRTSFDMAFALLAGQVKELAAKVNGSRPVTPRLALSCDVRSGF